LRERLSRHERRRRSIRSRPVPELTTRVRSPAIRSAVVERAADVILPGHERRERKRPRDTRRRRSTVRRSGRPELAKGIRAPTIREAVRRDAAREIVSRGQRGESQVASHLHRRGSIRRCSVTELTVAIRSRAQRRAVDREAACVREASRERRQHRRCIASQRDRPLRRLRIGWNRIPDRPPAIHRTIRQPAREVSAGDQPSERQPTIHQRRCRMPRLGSVTERSPGVLAPAVRRAGRRESTNEVGSRRELRETNRRFDDRGRRARRREIITELTGRVVAPAPRLACARESAGVGEAGRDL